MTPTYTLPIKVAKIPTPLYLIIERHKRKIKERFIETFGHPPRFTDAAWDWYLQYLKRQRRIEYWKAYHQAYYHRHKKASIAYSLNWQKKNKIRYLKSRRIWQAKHLRENEQFNIRYRLRISLCRAFSTYTKTGKVISSKRYGIDYTAIIEYLGPCPGDRDKYHIDHIIPLSTFDLRDKKQVKKAFAPENLQWLTAKKNQKKGNKLVTLPSIAISPS